MWPRTATEKRMAQMTEEKRLQMCHALNDSFMASQFGPGMLAMISAATYFGLFPQETLYLVFYCVATSICTLCFVFFLLKKHMTIPVTNVLVYALFILVGLPPGFATTQTGYYFASTWARALQLLISIVGPDLLHFIPVNLLHLAWELWIIFTSPGLQPALAHNLVLAFVTTGYKILLRVAATALFWQMGHAISQAVQSAHSEGNVRSILAVICDALVTLRCDLTLSEDSPQLASLLIGTPSITARRGQHFASLLVQEDVERFQDFVGQTPEEGSPARQLGLSLRDSTGNKVPVHMYHLCLKDPITQEPVHFVGLVEDNQGEFRGPPLAARTCTSSSGAAVLHGGASHEEAADAKSIASGTSACTASPGLTSWDIRGESASLTIRTWLNFEVVEESEGSRALFSFSEASGDMEHFASHFSKPHMFLRWLEFAHTMATLRYENPKNTFTDGVVRPLTSELEYKATISLSLVSHPATMPEEDVPAEVAVDFIPSSRFVTLQLNFAPPAPEPRRRQRGSQARQRLGHQALPTPLGL